MKKCPVCNGEGWVEHYDLRGCWKSNCSSCKGSGKNSITITFEEYENLKEKADQYDDLCR